MRYYALVAILAVCMLFNVSCASRKSPGKIPAASQTAESVADLRDFPQNLEVFARQAGANRRIIDAETQHKLYESFLRIYFGPWEMTRTSIVRREVAGLFKKARGYKMNGTPWTQPEWDAMRQNADLGQYPSMGSSAITLRNTSLRELPTTEARFSKPTPNVRENPFDYFQYSLLPVGMPLLVAHVSRDGQWYYIECPVAGGWVRSCDVALVDKGFKSRWQTGSYAALIRDNINISGTGSNGTGSSAGIGAILPINGKNGHGLSILVPKSGASDLASISEVNIALKDAVKMPMPLTASNVAKVGDVMMGQPYGWGGMLGDRDCSAMTRDLFAPFGIWLPRNSVAQARRGSVIPLEGFSAAEKEKIILEDGVPFLSLVGMRGHITLYVGKWKGRAAIFHNVWGVRVERDGNDNDRQVIGRAVVTSITPGMELANLYRPVTFVDRLRTLTRIGIR